MDQHAETKEALKRRRGKGVDLTIVLGSHRDGTPGAKQGPNEEGHDDDNEDNESELAPDGKRDSNADADHDPLDEGQPDMPAEKEDPEHQHVAAVEHPMEKMLDGEMGLSPLHMAAKAHHEKMLAADKGRKDVSHLGHKEIKGDGKLLPHHDHVMKGREDKKKMDRARMNREKLHNEGGSEDHDGGASDNDGY